MKPPFPVIYDNPLYFMGKLKGRDTLPRKHDFTPGTFVLGMPAGSVVITPSGRRVKLPHKVAIIWNGKHPTWGT